MTRRYRTIWLVTFALCFASDRSAFAQDYRWDDGGSGTNRSWDNPENWYNISGSVDNGVPPIGAAVQFGFNYSSSITVNLNGDRFVSSLAFGVPAQTTLTGGSLSVSGGVVTVYGNQFNGSTTTLPPNGPAVTAAVIIDSNLLLGTAGVIDVRGNAELRTNGIVSIGTGATPPGGLLTRQGSGYWSIGGTANTFGQLTLAPNLESGTVATTRFGDLGSADGGSLGVNAAGALSRIDWGVRNRLLYTGTTANQTLAKDIALTFTAGHQDIYSFETFNAQGAVGPNAGGLTLAGTISGDLTSGGAVTGSTLNFNVVSPTDPNFAVTLNGNNTFRALLTIQGGTVKVTHDNALGSPLTVVQLGSNVAGAGYAVDAALLVNAGRTISQKIFTMNRGGDILSTIGGAADFTTGTATFTGGLELGVGIMKTGANLVAHGSSLITFTGSITGEGGSLNFLGSDLRKTGTGTVRLTATSPVIADVIVQSGTLQLQGSGALTATGGILYVNTGGTVELNNTAGQLFNRIHGDRQINLEGGTLRLVGGSSHVGPTQFAPGASSIVVDPNGLSIQMNFAGIERRSPGGVMGGTIDFRTINGGVLGQNTRITMTLDPTLTNGILGGWATVNGADWAGYNTATNDILPFTNYIAFASSTATSNALVGDGATTNAVAAVNSLKIATSAAGGTLNTGGTLTIGTGGILHTGGQTYTIASALSAGANDLAVTTDGTLTLTETITAVGLSKSGPGTLVIGANISLVGSTSMNVNAGTLSFEGNQRLIGTPPRVNLTSPAAVGIDLNNTSQTIGLLTGSGSVAIGSGALTIRHVGGTVSSEQIMSGLFSGSGALTKIGTQSLTLSGDNPFTGSIAVQSGGLVLTGVNAAAGAINLTGSGVLTLRKGGTLAAASTQPITIGSLGSLQMVNNFDALMTTSYRGDRVADGRPILLAGGSIAFVGTQLPYVSASETLGALTIQPGASSISSSLSSVIATGGPAALTFTGVTRQVGSTVNFTNSNSGGTLGAAGHNSRLFFTSGLAAGFLPWATLNGTSFAYFNGDGLAGNTNGIQPLSAAAQTTFAAAGAADHAFLSGAGSLSANKTVISLHIVSTAANQSLDLGANDLGISSGGLLIRNGYSIIGTGTLGSPGTELVLHLISTSAAGAPAPVTIAVPLSGSAVTKSGGAPLILTSNSTYSGPTTIASASLQVLNPISSATDSATGTGAVAVLAGTILYGGDQTGTVGQITGPVAVAGTLTPGGSLTSGILTIRNDVTFSPDGSGRFTGRVSGNTPGTQYTQLRVIDGDVELNDAVLTFPFSNSPNAPVTIIDVSGGTINGLFKTGSGVTLADGAMFTTHNGVPWYIDYSPTSVVITPVPEPASVLALVAGAAGLAGLVRRRSRRGSTG